MATITATNLQEVGFALRKLAYNDVLIFDQWRITVAAGPDKPYWLSGYGRVYSIQRGRRTIAAIRKKVEQESSWTHAP